jgi:hypothetical protein
MRQYRSSGSVEGVMGNHDSYSNLTSAQTTTGARRPTTAPGLSRFPRFRGRTGGERSFETLKSHRFACFLFGWRWRRPQAEGNLTLQAGVVTRNAACLRTHDILNTRGGAGPPVFLDQVALGVQTIFLAIENSFFVPFGHRQRNHFSGPGVEHRNQQVPARCRECDYMSESHLKPHHT